MYSMTSTYSLHSSGYTRGQPMNATRSFKRANSSRLAASRAKSVSSKNVAHSFSTTSRRSSICSSFMKREAWRATMRMMSMSCAMVAFTPGRWIFTATTSPFTRRALCTCASEALPRGVGSMASKMSPWRAP